MKLAAYKDTVISMQEYDKHSRFKTVDELQKVQLTKIVYAAIECAYNKGFEKIRILDLATGPNRFNSRIVKHLNNEYLDYELVLSDASPEHFKKGYEHLAKDLTDEQLNRIRCVLVDLRDMRQELRAVPLYKARRMAPIKEVLENKEYSFLKSGYRDGYRTISFIDQSFDMVIGCMPYGSVGKNFQDAIKESVRILRPGGYHIVDEMEIVNINADAYRTCDAIQRAREPFIRQVRSQLDDLLEPITECSAVYKYKTVERFPSQTLQDGDIVRCTVLVHRKPLKKEGI